MSHHHQGKVPWLEDAHRSTCTERGLCTVDHCFCRQNQSHSTLPGKKKEANMGKFEFVIFSELFSKDCFVFFFT